MSSLEERRAKALEEYRKKLIEHRELDAKLKKSNVCVIFYLMLFSISHNIVSRLLGQQPEAASFGG